MTQLPGASFTLDGRGTSDPDANLALVSWHAGTRTGTELARKAVVQQSLGVGVSQSYVLRTVDTSSATDEATTSVAVVDTTPPELAISVSPTTLWPPNHKFEAIDVSVGQKVLYAKYAGTEFKIEGDELLIVSQKDILAIVEG